MKLRLILNIFVLIIFISNMSMADDKQKRIDRKSWGAVSDDSAPLNLAPYNLTPNPPVFRLELDPGYSTDAYILGPEILTGINGFYDYKTNGEVNHYIQVDPTDPTLYQAVDVISDSTEPGGATTRRTTFTVSTDGGATWTTLGNVPLIRSGFSVLKLLNGAGAIVNHNTSTGGVVNTNLYIDVAPGGGSFSQYNATQPPSIWPQMAVYNNGNIGVLSRPQHTTGDDTLFYQNWNGTVLGPKTVSYISTPPYSGTVGTNMMFNIAQNGAGRVTQVICSVLEDDTLGNAKIWSKTSTDNGANWGPLQLVFAPFTENSGEDTVGVSGGTDLAYKPNANFWVYSFAASVDGLYGQGRIYIVNSNNQRSIVTTSAAVGSATSFNKPMAFVYSIDQPALAYSADGNVLYCVFAVVKPDTGASGFNSRDIYYSRSLDDGATWGAPIQVTNTPLIDECYPSVSDFNKGNATTPYDLNMTYMKDPGVGPTAYNGTSPTAPASRNYQIYRKVSQANVIGISQNEINVNDYKLNQNYPNPFNPATTISYNMVKGGYVSLKIFDLLGREIKTLVNEYQQPGLKEINFDASSLSSGTYFYRISANGFSDIKKMTLLK